MFNPQHCGLIFTENHIQQARSHKNQAPLAAAWEYLLTAQLTHPLAALQLDGWRYRFNADVTAGERAATALQQQSTTLVDDVPLHEAITQTFILAQCFEMLRDHPAYEPGKQAQFLDHFFDRVSKINQRIYEPTLVETLWLAVLNTAAGIVLGREPIFLQGVQVFKHTIDEKVHPEGYLPDVVEHDTEIVSMQNQLLCAQALSLIAEMAAHTGLDLWTHEKRGVSVLTAVTYPLYYYFYPEKWPWNGEQWKPSDGVELTTAQQMFKQNAAFLEIAGPRYLSPLKAIQMILDEIRPVYDLNGGGLTTLSHAVPKRKRRSLFRSR